MTFHSIRLKKKLERRAVFGHPWVFSNEVDTKTTPLTQFDPGEEVTVFTANGQLLGSAYVNPHSLIFARFYSDQQESLSLTLIQQRIESAYRLRKTLFSKPFYRLVFAESDGLPGLVIDRFNQDFVIQINTAGMEQKIDFIAKALKNVFPNLNSMVLKNDSTVRVREQLPSYVRHVTENAPSEIILEENGVQFYVPLSTGQKTGWFYDHRMSRERLKIYAPDKNLLDVCSYLGGWGIQAGVFGAKSITCIESSALACNYITKNATLNQVADRLSVINADAFDTLKNLVNAKQTFDVIVVDPPAFIKKMKDKNAGLVAYQRLNGLAMKLLNPEGILISCSCSMHLSEENLIDLILREAHKQSSIMQLVERGQQGPDHPIQLAIPETAYLKALFMRKLIR